MAYQAILFDLDDTLYDYRAYWVARLRHALGGIVARHPNLALDELIAAAIAKTVYSDDLPAWLGSYNVVDAALVAEAQERYRENWYDQLALFEDAPSLLNRLRARYRLGLITNGPVRTQRPKIAQFGLEQLMDVIVVSAEVGLWKPDPAIFRLALERLGVAPHQALFVGDSLTHDLPGAQAAGMAFVWMNPRREPLLPDLPPPLASIERLAQLEDLLLFY